MDRGDSWQTHARSSGKQFSSVLWPKGELPGNPGVPWAGAWTNGLYLFSRPILSDTAGHDHRLPVLHLRQADTTLLVGTWGRELLILE